MSIVSATEKRELSSSAIQIIVNSSSTIMRLTGGSQNLLGSGLVTKQDYRQDQVFEGTCLFLQLLLMPLEYLDLLLIGY